MIWFIQMPAHRLTQFPQLLYDSMYLVGTTVLEIRRYPTEGKAGRNLRPNGSCANLRCLSSQAFGLVLVADAGLPLYPLQLL